MTIKKGDFIEVDYTGSVAETNEVFDTTVEHTAKEHNLFDEKQTYAPAVICIGEQQLLKGLDDKLVDKDIGTHTITLSPEEAFGKKSAKLIQLIPTNKFRKQGITPVPGLQMNIDDMMGTVKAVSGGRTIVDFNHPLSGKDVSYEIAVKRKVDDVTEQIQSFVERMGFEDVHVAVENNNATVTLANEIPKEIQEKVGEKLIALTAITAVHFKKNNNSKVMNKNI